ncbi:MAG: hypothetical protein II642_07315 [Firmicutes bacterium]|nr:hypothetical protein [Bacillota bacterium]
MIRLHDIKLPIETEAPQLEKAVRSLLSVSDLHPLTVRIIRRSLDARRYPDRFQYVYTLDVTIAKEDKIVKRLKSQRKIKWEQLAETPHYTPPTPSALPSQRPVVVGLGPAGLFCSLLLARAGLKPLIIERGRPVEQRTRDTQLFFHDHILDPESNVQFGEGGAGAYSDGKLNTLIKDPTLRGGFVMREFVKAGAPEEILYAAKPHVGTDRLQIVVKNMREELLSLGAEIRFETKLIGFERTEDSRIKGIYLESRDGTRVYEETDTVFLGIGHSARDTFEMLAGLGIPMEQKPFAMGLRIEHPRTMIDQSQYREYAGSPYLGAASYKLTAHTESGRSLYTFCMCPGGVVIASASEPETVVTNGMSDFARDKENSNSALLVNVTPEDYASYNEEGGVLAGMLMQRDLERKAYLLGGSTYQAPVQTTADFLASRPSTAASFGDITPSFTAGVTPANLREILPVFIGDTIAEGLAPGGLLGRKLSGFDRPDAVLTGVESRSSSPVRIVRDESLQSTLRGLYPMGEGAGYAGGITSAAIDGMKCAEMYLQRGTR